MSKRIPALWIGRPAQNIGEKDINYFEKVLSDRNPFVEQEQIRRLFPHGGEFSSTLVSRAELLELHRRIGIGRHDEERVEELARHIESVLPPFSREKLTVPTLPANIYKHGRRTTLTAAESMQLVQERALVIAAIHNFYEIEEPMLDVWGEARRAIYMTAVRLGRANKAAGAKQLKTLGALLVPGNTLVPADTRFDPVEIRRNYEV